MIRRHAAFSPSSSLEGEPLRFPPSNGRPIRHRAPCLPSSGQAKPGPAAKEAYPLRIPADLFTSQIRKTCSPRGSALLLLSVEEPCPLRLFTRPSSFIQPEPIHTDEMFALNCGGLYTELTRCPRKKNKSEEVFRPNLRWSLHSSPGLFS
jgi:hypothetical protein